jgi:hypothetical protein
MGIKNGESANPTPRNEGENHSPQGVCPERADECILFRKNGGPAFLYPPLTLAKSRDHIGAADGDLISTGSNGSLGVVTTSLSAKSREAADGGLQYLSPYPLAAFIVGSATSPILALYLGGYLGILFFLMRFIVPPVHRLL